MTAAPELTADELARVAAFDAAPILAESAPMTRAMLALAEELEASANRCSDIVARIELRDAAARIRTAVTAVLAADPEPRDAKVERMARAIYLAEPPVDPTLPFEQTVEREQAHYRRLAASALEPIGAPE